MMHGHRGLMPTLVQALPVGPSARPPV